MDWYTFLLLIGSAFIVWWTTWAMRILGGRVWWDAPCLVAGVGCFVMSLLSYAGVPRLVIAGALIGIWVALVAGLIDRKPKGS